jgi:protein-S-isoprenylcysteine O-methyltransferase Ste14
VSTREMTDLLVAAVLVACWGTVGVVWFLGALYNAAKAPHAAARMQSTPVIPIAASILACSVVLLVGQAIGQGLTTDELWVRLLGFAVLLGSTVFALWARFSLGTSWSVGATVRGDRRLRTSGPYAVTRHPIYTGLVGMLLGTTLLAGIGQWIVLVVAGVIVAEVKIWMEEELLMAAFPDEYPRYRRRVPQIIPGLRLHRHDGPRLDDQT